MAGKGRPQDFGSVIQVCRILCEDPEIVSIRNYADRLRKLFVNVCKQNFTNQVGRRCSLWNSMPSLEDIGFNFDRLNCFIQFDLIYVLANCSIGSVPKGKIEMTSNDHIGRYLLRERKHLNYSVRIEAVETSVDVNLLGKCVPAVKFVQRALDSATYTVSLACILIGVQRFDCL